MSDWNSSAEEQTELFSTADHLLEALTNLTKAIARLAGEEEVPSEADLKWRELHRLHKLNKQALLGIQGHVSTFVGCYRHAPRHTVFPRLVTRLNRVIRSSIQGRVGDSELCLEDLTNEGSFKRPYQVFGESNNNNIRHLYRKLYASDIDARRSSTAQLMKFVLKNLVSGNGNGIEPPIAKSNMIYMEAVDLLEKHTDVLQRESLEASGEFDMTLSLTENISRMMDGMMVRNRIAQKTINGYAMDHSDFVARQTRLGRQKNSFVTRLSRTSGTRKHSNLGLTSQSSLGQRSSYIQQSFWAQVKRRSTKDSRSTFGMGNKRFSIIRSSEGQQPTVKKRNDSIKPSPFQKKLSAVRQSVRNSGVAFAVATRLSTCDSIKERRDEIEDHTRLQTCLSVLGLLQASTTTTLTNTNEFTLTESTTATKVARRISPSQFQKQERVKSTLHKFLSDPSQANSSHHFRFGEQTTVVKLLRHSITTMRCPRFSTQHPPPTDELFIAVKERQNLHNMDLLRAPPMTYADFTFSREL